jgi:type I restriction enzyme S subunit
MRIPAKYAARFINGNAFKPSDWGDQGLPILRIAQLSGQPFDNFYDGNFDERYRVTNGDLLFAWSATIDSFYWNRGEAVLNQHIFKVIPKNGVSKRFLFYSLKHYSQIWADFDAHGSTTRHIKKESLSNKIYLPDIHNQEAIANFLDRETQRIDKLIEKHERFLSLIEEKKTALVSKAIDGSILSLTAGDISGWFGNLPHNWNLLRGKFFMKERQDRSVFGNEELLSVSHITGVTRRADKEINMFLAESMEDYKLVSPGDIVVNTMWAWMGAMGVSDFEGLISPSYNIYTPTNNILIDKYLDLLLRSPQFVAEVNRRSKGVWSSRLRLYPDAFLDIRFPIPEKNVQIQILKFLEQATFKEDNLKKLNNISINRLREFRSCLITAAVTGQIDVTTWSKGGGTSRQIEAIESEIGNTSQPALKEVQA